MKIYAVHYLVDNLDNYEDHYENDIVEKLCSTREKALAYIVSIDNEPSATNAEICDVFPDDVKYFNKTGICDCRPCERKWYEVYRSDDGECMMINQIGYYIEEKELD